MASRRRRSRTPSAANYAQRDARRLASLTFFLDRNLGRNIIAPRLRAAGANVELHDDHFSQQTPDSEWLSVVGERDWVMISRDKNIRRNPLERAAFEWARLRGFVLTGGGSIPDDAELLVRSLPGMLRRTAGRPGPLLFAISRGGVFTRLL